MPDDKDIRNDRLLTHRNQLEFLKNKFPNQSIYIVSQNYSSTDYTDSADINYIDFKEGIGPGKARNELLALFYNSDDDFLLLMDDDVIWYDYYNVDEFVHNMYENKYNEDIDAVVLIEPAFKPFKKFIYEKTNYAEVFVLKKVSPVCLPNILLLKNIKKYHDIEIYYDDVDFRSNEAYAEDSKFVCDLMYNGMKFYENTSWIKKNLLYNHSSSIFLTRSNKESTEAHKNSHNNFITKIIPDRYNVAGIKEFNKAYNKALDYLLISRQEKYVMPESLKPVYKSSGNLLF